MEPLIVFLISSTCCVLITGTIYRTKYSRITKSISFKEFVSMCEKSPENFTFYATCVVDNLTNICIQFNLFDTIRMNIYYAKYKRNMFPTVYHMGIQVRLGDIRWRTI